MTFARALVVAAAVATSSQALSAEPAAAEPKSAPAAAPAATATPASATATELARLLVPKESWSAGVGQISQNVQQQMQSHPGASLHYPADFPQKVRAEVEKVMPYDEFVGLHAKQLSASFAEPELKEVLAFYRTPAGQKWLRDSGKSSQAVAAETQKRFGAKMPELMSRLAGMAKPPAGSGKHDKPAKDGGK